MPVRAIDANALIEKIRFREGPVMGQRDIFLIEGEPTLTLNNLRDEIYEDAVAHGLWEDEDGIDWYQECHSMIECEVDELYDAIEDRANGHGDENFREELADVIIMSLSVAGKLGIDIDAAVRRKMEINKGRAWKHGKGSNNGSDTLEKTR